DGAQANTIGGNLIGVVLTGSQAGSSSIRVQDTHGNSAGNLADGIFLLGQNTTGNLIRSNVISANRGFGIHAFGGRAGSQPNIDLIIAGNFIGTNNDGTRVLDDLGNTFGNGSDGVFLDSVSGVSIGGATSAQGSPNLISGNRANGINLLQAT